MRENLKNARKQAGMTQQQMADKLDNDNVRWKMIRNGVLVVCENGDIYRKYRDGWGLFSSICKSPYIQIGIIENGKQVQLLVHRLVAEAFIPNPFGYEQVNHIDGNSHNNAVRNLEWCDAGYNVRDSKKRHAPRYLTNLRRIRIEYGMTISSVSRSLKIMQGVYADIENAVRKPIPMVANKLEEMFGESIEYLLSPAEGCEDDE